MNDSRITVIGKGEIGDKARQLSEKTPKLKEIGFYTPKRHVLAEGYFDDFFKENYMGNTLRDIERTENLEEAIRNGNLTIKQFEILEDIINSYDKEPLAVRSSAAGDARGTGTYKSIFCANNAEAAMKAVFNVLASYFSEDAVAFRKDAKTGEGFGIMIEPLIGQVVDDMDGCCFFGPVISGFGYTSTSRGDSYICTVPGIGGGVESRDGEKITKKDAEEVKGSLYELIISRQDQQFFSKSQRKSGLLRTNEDDLNRYGHNAYSGDIFWDDAVYRRPFVLKTELAHALNQINLNPLFEKIKKTEEAFGKPQYFEWAMTIQNGQPRYWINQIADVDKKVDTFNFEDQTNIIYTGHNVTGAGEKICDKIAYCWNPDDEYHLTEFNKKKQRLYADILKQNGNRKIKQTHGIL